MKTILPFFTVFMIFFTVQASNIDHEKLFNEANQLQKEKHFDEAFKLYKKIEASKIQSFELFYNIGVNRYKENNIGSARAYFEKALHIKPRDLSALNNLNLVLQELKKEPYSPYSNPLNVLTNYEWLLIIVFSILVLSTSFLLFKFIEVKRLKKISLSFIVIAIFFLLLSLIGYFSSKFAQSEAIFKEKSGVYENPLNNTPILETLEEGQKVVILEHLEGWTRIQNGNTSFWVRSNNIIEI